MKSIPEIIKMLEKDVLKYEKALSSLNPHSLTYLDQKDLLEKKILAAKKDITDWGINDEPS